jgi:hypothetical protein
LSIGFWEVDGHESQAAEFLLGPARATTFQLAWPSWF